MLVQKLAAYEFLSTPSARRATAVMLLSKKSLLRISIHALREEGDAPTRPIQKTPVGFLSTPSARRATDILDLIEVQSHISIHALREEGDVDNVERLYLGKVFLSTPSARRATGKHRRTGYSQQNFYPRPPRGGRQKSMHKEN